MREQLVLTAGDITAQRERQLLDDLRAVMATESGRRVIAWVRNDLAGRDGVIDGHLYSDNRDGVSAYGQQCFQVGKHDLGVDLEIVLKRASRDLFRKMCTERDHAEELAISLMTESERDIEHG
jgi:hypothetical protein